MNGFRHIMDVASDLRERVEMQADPVGYITARAFCAAPHLPTAIEGIIGQAIKACARAEGHDPILPQSKALSGAKPHPRAQAILQLIDDGHTDSYIATSLRVNKSSVKHLRSRRVMGLV